ncbi:MAG: hypothetical protein H7836_14630, partial [Magnetococcus sp. YQC-3]
SLAARTSILASMNPKMGRFDDYNKKYVDQIDIEAALLSRFDLIFAVTDKPNTENDEKIIDHINKTIYAEGTVPSNSNILAPDFIRKYIHYAKKIKPIITEEVNNKIKTWFIDNRSIQDFHINFRHYEATRRLTEASAKIRLAPTATIADANRAINLFNCSLNSLGVQDIDAITTGITAKDKTILQAVSGMLPSYWNDILALGYKEEDIQGLLDKELLFQGKDSKIYVKERET